MNKILISGFLFLSLLFSACEYIPLPGTTDGSRPLTDGEILSGLKEAINVGTKKAAEKANMTDAFFKNQLLFIAFPPEAQKVADQLRKIGANQIVDDFTLALNRAAENAAIKATPIFADAVRKMSWEDVRKILKGPENSATLYFKQTTYQSLYQAFYPVIKESLGQVNATQYWGDITTLYNQIPLVKPVNPDIAQYTTTKALDGLFILLAKEEASIRKDPAARVTDILKRVFGYTGDI